MEGAVSDVGVCNLAYAGRLEELRAQLLHDKALATKTDQVSRRRSSLSSGGRAAACGAAPCGAAPVSRLPLLTFPLTAAPSFPPSGQPHRAALGLLGRTHGRGRPPPRPWCACGRQRRCECRGIPHPCAELARGVGLLPGA